MGLIGVTVIGRFELCAGGRRVSSEDVGRCRNGGYRLGRRGLAGTKYGIPALELRMRSPLLWPTTTGIGALSTPPA